MSRKETAKSISRPEKARAPPQANNHKLIRPFQIHNVQTRLKPKLLEAIHLEKLYLDVVPEMDGLRCQMVRSTLPNLEAMASNLLAMND